MASKQSAAERRVIEHWAERIFQAYPRHAAKGGPRGALEAIKRAINRIEDHPAKLLEITQLFAAVWEDAKNPNHPEHQFIPHPTTWFNQERYNDSEKEWRPRRMQRQQSAQQMPFRAREQRINDLNRRKAALMRMPESPRVLRELEQIRIQLHSL